MLSLLLFLFVAPAQADLRPEFVKLPPGFKIEILAEGMKQARQLALDPASGTIFVGSHANEVYALPPGPSVSAKRTPVRISGLNGANGVAFRDGALYVGEVARILKYDDILKRLTSTPSPKVVRGDLPDNRWHGWRYIKFGPDGFLYFGVGAPCNVCKPSNPIFGTIQRMKPDGSGLEPFASGIRNSVGFDWDPKDSSLWFTDNGRDHLGDDKPPDELNHATKKGMFFGFPFCHGKGIVDPEFGAERACSTVTTAAQELGPHVASLGMHFYQGKMFPADYRGRIFIAEHGSWNRSTPLGYRITTVKLAGGKPVSYEVFAEGWLQKEGPWGRPVDVLELPDGSLAVSDDFGGAVYRITWNPR